MYRVEADHDGGDEKSSEVGCFIHLFGCFILFYTQTINLIFIVDNDEMN